MTLEVFSEEDFRSDIADWAELYALTNVFRQVTSSQFSRARSIIEDEDHQGTDYDGALDAVVDSEIAQLEEEQRALSMLEEFGFRRQVLGDVYPFDLNVDTHGWTLVLRRAPSTPGIIAGRIAYLSCLLVSGIRSSAIQLDENDPNAKQFEQKAAHMLQLLSCVAAAELVNGTAYWMGWPREDRRTRLRSALEEFVGLVGYGKVKDEDPEWSTGHEKDGTVDVIAWRSFPDKYWSGPIVFGQVASGNNWTTKSVKTQLNSHFFEWFAEAPGEPGMTALAAMFIPFPAHQRVKETSKVGFDARAVGTARRHAKEFGLVIDRNRLSLLVCDRYAKRRVDRYIDKHAAELLRWLGTGRALVGN